MVMVVVLVASLFLPFVANFGDLHNWLLAEPLPWFRYPTLAPQPVHRFVARQLFVTLGSAVAAALITASLDALRF